MIWAELPTRLTELLKQPQNDPLPVEEQVVVIYAGTRGWTDSVPVEHVRRFEVELREYMRANHAELLAGIRSSGKLPEESDLEGAMRSFLEGFDTGKSD